MTDRCPAREAKREPIPGGPASIPRWCTLPAGHEGSHMHRLTTAPAVKLREPIEYTAPPAAQASDHPNTCDCLDTANSHASTCNTPIAKKERVQASDTGRNDTSWQRLFIAACDSLARIMVALDLPADVQDNPDGIEEVLAEIARLTHSEDSAGKDGEPDWRDLYRFQTAMRYMDNTPALSRERAMAMADQDVLRIESDTAREATQDREGTP